MNPSDALRRGLSMLEIVVALGLLTLMLPLVFDLIPGGILAQRRGSTIQAAAALANKWILEARSSSTPALSNPSPPPDRDEWVDISGVSCHATRQFFLVSSPNLPAGTAPMWDVVVTIRPSRGEPVRLATRIPAQ